MGRFPALQSLAMHQSNMVEILRRSTKESAPRSDVRLWRKTTPHSRSSAARETEASKRLAVEAEKLRTSIGELYVRSNITSLHVALGLQ